MVEESDLDTEVTPYSSGPVLPEDVPVMKDSRGEGPKEVTWDHPNHGDFTTEPLCDVGKMSLKDFESAKVSREEGRKKSGDSSRRRSDKERKNYHTSSKSHSSREKHSSSNTSHSSLSKDKSHSSSSKDKSQTSTKYKSKSDSSTHSSSRDKSHRISSKSKSHSSSSKEKSSSSSSKDESQSKSSRQSFSSEKDNEKPHSSSKSLGLNSEAAAANVDTVKADLQARVNKATAAIEAAAAEVKADNADFQARIIKATAAIEAAKMSGNELLCQIGQSSSQEEVEPGSPPALDLDIADIDDVERGDGRRYSSGADGEVSSTVTIATPEQWEVENINQEPSVWEGQVIMQDVAKFSVSAYQVSGTSDYLREDLKTSLTLVGTISPSLCLYYIEEISKNSSFEILVMRLSPNNNDDKDSYQEFFKNLSIKDRYASTPPSLE